MSASSTAQRLAISILCDIRDASPSSRQRFVDELLVDLRECDDAALRRSMIAFAARDRDRRDAFANIATDLAQSLAIADDPPDDPAAVTTWHALVEAVDAVFGSGVYALGSLPFLGQGLRRRLLDEARAAMPDRSTQRRTTGGAGDALARLAVSRQLREAVTRAVGVDVVPTYDALYEFDPPDSHVRTHLDAAGFPIVCHVILEHTDGGGEPVESVLVSHHAGESAPRRDRLHGGEGIVVRGRGTLHSWRRLGAGEHRILVAIGFDVTSA